MSHRSAARSAARFAPLAALIAGTLFTLPAGAQAGGSGSPLRLGILLGANSATLGGRDADASERRTAFVGGAYLIKSLGSGLALRPELLLSQKGATGSVVDDELDQSIAVTFELAYVDVPILLQLDLGSGGSARPHLYAGPSLGFKSDCKLTGSEGPVEITLDCDDDEFELESFDLGGVIGGGVRFGLGALQGTVGARYQHGFSDIAKDAKVQNRVISLYGSVEFGRR